MLLSDRDIKKAVLEGEITITPYHDKYVQPASYDVHLSETLLMPIQPQRVSWWQRLLGIKPPYVPYCFDPLLDRQPLKEIHLFSREAEDFTGDYFYLPPGGVALGATQEKLTLDARTRIAADIAGCSSLGRWFMFVHVTAGFIDPGWGDPQPSPLTLELYNASPWYIRMWAGMRIAQLRFYELTMTVDRPYGQVGAYVGSTGPVRAQYRSA